MFTPAELQKQIFLRVYKQLPFMGPAFDVLKGVGQWWAVRGCLIGRVQFHVVGKNATC